MKITNVLINNWNTPGNSWWKSVSARSSEPLIETTMTMVLSWTEYKELLAKDKLSKAHGGVVEKARLVSANSIKL